MKLIEALESGACGALFTPPESAVLGPSEKHGVMFHDPRTELQWMVTFGDVALDLAPEHDALLADDALRAAQAVFAGAAAELDAAEAAGRAPKSRPDPRTKAADWSPLLEFKPVSIGNTTGLRAVHYAALREGLEIVVGHVIVPVAFGVLEFRCTNANRGRSAKSAGRALEKVHAGLDWLAEPGRLDVVRPAVTPRTGTMTLDAFGASFTAPPRFALADSAEYETVLFTRLSLSTTDNVWRLAVVREAVDAVLRQRPLRTRVEDVIAKRFGLGDLSAMKVELKHRDDGSARITVQSGGDAQLALASVWWLHPDGGLRGLQLSAPEGVSLDETLGLLDACAASWTVTN